MDVNGDGRTDILSGSYSRHDPDMAGLFQVLYGRKQGGFAAAVPLTGTDGEPLIIAMGEGGDEDDGEVGRICTRPTAVDLDGDGELDIVSGNFVGTFALFRGEGEGRFAPKSTLLPCGDAPLAVQHHSDPFFVDWDGDGDLDLISGSAQGGVYLCTNRGSVKEPEFAAPRELVPAVGYPSEVRMGDGWLRSPQSATRVCAADVDRDGKLDLLVGDDVTLYWPSDGISEQDAVAKFAAWQDKQQKFFESNASIETQEQREAWQKGYEALEKERDAFARQEMTGFVWLYRGR